MDTIRYRWLGRLLLGALLGASAATTIAGGRGGGGDSGDSSMNPFTGESYRYFNGGHNRGEEVTGQSASKGQAQAAPRNPGNAASQNRGQFESRAPLPYDPNKARQ